MKRISLASLVLGPALLLAALLAPGSAAAAGPITSTACTSVGTAVTCNLWAKSASADHRRRTGHDLGLQRDVGRQPDASRPDADREPG